MLKFLNKFYKFFFGFILIKKKVSSFTRSKIGLNCRISELSEFNGCLENIKLGSSVSINSNVSITCTDKNSWIEIGDNTVLKSYSMLITHPGGFIKIGRNCSVNPFCVLYGHGGLEIGNDVRIATHTVFIPANHNFESLDIPS